MDATATIAQLSTARQQAERADYRGALRNFDAVLQKLEQYGNPTPSPTVCRGATVSSFTKH